MIGKFKPSSLLKNLAAGISVVTMCIAPVAEGAAASNQKKLINQYLKETGLTTKKMTVGEYWRMVRHVYPDHLQSQMDQWVALNRNQMMPSIEASTFKDSNGNEQVRLTLTKDGQTMNLNFTGDEENPLKVNGVPVQKKELLNYNSFNALAGKLAKQDPMINKSLKTGKQKPLGNDFVLSYKEYVKLSARQKAEYMIRMRRAMEAAQRVYTAIYGAQAMNEFNSSNKYEFVLNFLFGEEAQAAGLTGKNCIVAGYLSVYGENGSCGGNKQGADDLKRKMAASGASCASNGVACNPMVYGFNSSGQAFCVSRADVKYATRTCNSMSPLNGGDEKSTALNKKRIIESYLKSKGQNIDLQLNDENKIPEEQYKQIATYLTDLKAYISSAIGACDTAPLKDIQKQREDQVNACQEIKDRAFELQAFAVNPTPPTPLPNPDPGVNNCTDQGRGQAGPDGQCKCPEGQKEGEGGICMIVETGGGGDLPGGKEVTKKEDSCGFWCRNKNWIIPVGVGLLALGAFWWLFKKDSKAKSTDPVYVPPAPVPEPTATATATPPVVEPPPPAPCPAPNTLVNGVCVPPVVVPPPTTTTEGGTKTDDGIKAGGVR